MAQYDFGSGVLYGTRTDVANSTPRAFGALQEVSIDLNASSKPLFGSYQYPLAVARGTCKISGKAKFAQIDGHLYNDLFFGQASTTGTFQTAFQEGPDAIPSTPYQITVVNSATFVDDLGVLNSSTGTPMTKVASSPSAGQYSVSAGVYTFSSADHTSAISVLISYTYSGSGTAPNQATVVTNQLLGVTPTFQINFMGQQPGGSQFNLKFYQCVSSKLSFATKLEDWMIPEFDFDCFANSSNQIFEYSSNQ